jgi:hypothetical protein
MNFVNHHLNIEAMKMVGVENAMVIVFSSSNN